MDQTALTWIIFILAFGGMVIIHEFGHFIVARLCNIEVEEFGIGLPTPGAITYWISKGYLLLRSGTRVEIPRNFRMPVSWNSLLGHEAKITVDQTGMHWILRSIEIVEREHSGESETGQKTIKVGNKTGTTQLADIVREVHPGTRFTLNWLPLGGFVRPKGENDPNIPGGLAAASPGSRFAVLVAGPLMNLLTAVVVYSFIFARVGVPDTNRVLVTDVVAESPAAQGGFESGDIFISADGQPISTYDDLRAIVDGNDSLPVVFLVERDGGQVELTAIPKFNETEGRAMIGVGLGVPYITPTSLGETIQFGTRYTYLNARTLLSLPAQLIRGSLTPEQSRVIGLKGIYDIMEVSVERGIEASETAPQTQPFDWYIPALELVAALSISLGIFNLFPFPALDGGRIIFLLPELIFRRRVPARIENLVHGVGMTVLLLFMIYVNVMDFVNPLNLTAP